MSESRPNKAVTDEELIGVLTAISVVSRRLARKLIQLNQTSQSQEGGKALTLEEVRAILAEKSRDGFTAQIRDLLLKYGAKKLSEVDPASYKALVADAEVLGNG